MDEVDHCLSRQFKVIVYICKDTEYTRKTSSAFGFISHQTQNNSKQIVLNHI